MNPAPQIKGWCPSAWRPMLTGDGYLVRLNFSCGIVSSQRARVIACLAERFGNGVIDLTRRANLQIRGVTEDQILELQAALISENLIPDGRAGKGMANVIGSPLAGRDRDAPLDIRPLARELEVRFATDPRLHELPAKFCVTIDDGGRFPLHDLSADITFEACERNSGFHFAVGMGGNSIGFADTEQVADTAVTLAAAFNSLTHGHSKIIRRVRDLVAEVGLAAITASSPSLRQASAEASARPQVIADRGKPGHEAVGRIADDVFGAAAPFGSLHPNQLALLSDLADHHAEGELRLTPWRAILIPAIASGAIERVKAECARAGLITLPCDPRRRIEACTGAPGCASASVSTRDVAAVLAPLLRAEDTLHVSGCAKSCASSSAASVTLVGRDGRFDLVRDGKPGERPARFGLSVEAARSALGRIVAEDLADA